MIAVLFVYCEEMSGVVRCKTNSKAGVSHALMVILMVVLALAIGGVVAAILMGYPGMLATKADVSIEKVDLVATGQSVIVIRNTGNVRITELTVTVDCESGASTTIPSSQFSIGEGLDPGKSVATTFPLSNAVPGELCTISLTGTAANGASIAASASAYVRP